MQPIRPTDLQFEQEKLLESVRTVLAKYPMHPVYQQVSLTHSAQAGSAEEKAYDGLGSLYDFETRRYKRDPADFVIFNEEFKSLYLHEVYQEVTKWSPLRLGRVRLMLRKPSSCYSMHADESMRYHIAVITNPGCYFFYKEFGGFQMPADGRLYYFDATHSHTGFNAGPTDRVHLVFDTIEWRFQKSKRD